MLNRFFIVLIGIAFVGCGPDEEVKESASILIDEKTQPLVRQEKKSINKDYVGKWVNDIYLNELEKTKSARKSQGSCKITVVDLYEPNMVGIRWKLHEGDDSEFLFISDNEFEIKDLASFTINDEGKLIWTEMGVSESYTKYDLNIGTMGSNNAINEIIFEGDYINLSDSTKVSFSKEGNVNGLKDYSSYLVPGDYFDAGMQYDKIFFDYTNGRDIKQAYIWAFVDDTLMFYDIDCKDEEDDYCTVIEKGDIVYKLLKNDK